MRSVGFAVAAAALLGGVTEVAAQGVGFGRRTNQEQHQPGYQRPAQKEEKRFPLGQSWIAVSINGKPYGGTERPTFRLDDQFRLHGFGGCNTFSATAYPLREQGIAVGPIAMTRKSCDKGVMAAEMQYLTALRTSAKWDTVVGSLVIKGPNGEIKFERSL
ncbi:META domain-containing protein [Enterovirga aerilata]|uniref:META domain-containing protein n=1 Tax=Enterovirga aerilata TaxID=2730920 RepID=A0A849I6X3_9HYPH|nr:META domain-containing protein [Enterovirga sp. DB1703]NNM72159.1 META domain-containing protein [Enterovirga sp. DB1703]